jgi:hypothetical protein
MPIHFTQSLSENFDHPDTRRLKEYQPPPSRSLAEPESTLVRIHSILEQSKGTCATEADLEHVRRASECCERLIYVVRHPETPRGPNELGVALRLLGDLVAAHLFAAQQASTSQPATAAPVPQPADHHSPRSSAA